MPAAAAQTAYDIMTVTLAVRAAAKKTVFSLCGLACPTFPCVFPVRCVESVYGVLRSMDSSFASFGLVLRLFLRLLGRYRTSKGRRMKSCNGYNAKHTQITSKKHFQKYTHFFRNSIACKE